MGADGRRVQQFSKNMGSLVERRLNEDEHGGVGGHRVDTLPCQNEARIIALVVQCA